MKLERDSHNTERNYAILTETQAKLIRTVQCCGGLNSAAQYFTALYSAVQYCTAQHSAVMYCTTQHCKALYRTALYRTVQHLVVPSILLSSREVLRKY